MVELLEAETYFMKAVGLD